MLGLKLNHVSKRGPWSYIVQSGMQLENTNENQSVPSYLSMLDCGYICYFLHHFIDCVLSSITFSHILPLTDCHMAIWNVSYIFCYMFPNSTAVCINPHILWDGEGEQVCDHRRYEEDKINHEGGWRENVNSSPLVPHICVNEFG